MSPGGPGPGPFASHPCAQHTCGNGSVGLMGEILIGSCKCNFKGKVVMFNACNVIGNFQNMGNMKEKAIYV